MEDTWFSFTKILLIIIILSVLGLNVFYYLGRTTDAVVNVGKQATGLVAEGAKKTTALAAKGVGTTVDVAGGVVKSGTNVAAGVIESSIDELERVLDIKVSDSVPSPDTSDSSVQEPRKSGYCFIGAEKGFRSCVYVGRNDKCMSNQVFPTMDVCINPRLRA